MLKRFIIVHGNGLQESLQARPNSHELFGYDFVVDQALNVWLIEVNCSPSLEHSTPVTARLCAQMMDDLFKVIIILSVACTNSLAVTQCGSFSMCTEALPLLSCSVMLLPGSYLACWSVLAGFEVVQARMTGVEARSVHNYT